MQAASHRGLRITVGAKIFALASSLLLLASLIAVRSILRIASVTDEIDAVNKYFMPIAEVVARINNDIVIAGSAFDRGLHVLQVQGSGAPELQGHLDAFQRSAAQVEPSLQRALAIADAGLKDTDHRSDAIEFARLQPLLANIGKQAKDFIDQASALLTAKTRPEAAAEQVLVTVVRKEWDEIFDAIWAVRQALLALTDQATVRARDHEKEVLRLNLLLLLGATLLGLLLGGIVAHNLVRPVQRLLVGTRAVEQGNLDVSIPVAGNDELASLTIAFNHMVDELRIRGRIKDTFGKYIDPRIVERLLQESDKGRFAGEKRVMTVLFSDMVGFTTISEELTAEALVRLINDYLTQVTQPIRASGGIIDKYVGDAIMAFWGPPFVDEREHARQACLAALAMGDELQAFRQRLPDLMGRRKGLPDINMRIGIATGEMIVGSIGSELARSYTVMGDTVNLGSRLESASKQLGTRLLISEATREAAGDAVETREIDSIQVVGKTEPMRVFELAGRKGELDPVRQQLRERFEGGLTAYRQRRWAEAQMAFQACLTLVPEDGPSKVLLERLALLRDHPPEEDWDGVWHLTKK